MIGHDSAQQRLGSFCVDTFYFPFFSSPSPAFSDTHNTAFACCLILLQVTQPATTPTVVVDQKCTGSSTDYQFTKFPQFLLSSHTSHISRAFWCPEAHH
jgi:hypothetical protein